MRKFFCHIKFGKFVIISATDYISKGTGPLKQEIQILRRQITGDFFFLSVRDNLRFILLGLSEELKEFKYGISSELAKLRNEMTFQINQEVAVVNLKLEQIESRMLYSLESNSKKLMLF